MLPTSYLNSDTETFREPPRPAEIVVLYDDRSSLQNAMHVLGESVCDLANASELCLLPWRFAEVQLEPWRERALNDAAECDLLVLSIGGDTPLPDDILEWVAASFTRRLKRSGRVMMVHGHEEQGRYFETAYMQLMRRVAAFSGVGFVTPDEWMSPGRC